MPLVTDLDLLPQDVFDELLIGPSDPSERKQLEAARRIAYARRSPGRFGYTTQAGFWQWARHLEALDEIMLQVAGGGKFVIVSLPVRAGKQLKCTESVRTGSRGVVPHGELRQGDLVYHPSGQLVEVLANTGVQEPARYVRVSFSDNTHMDCHPNHEWNLKHRAENRFRTREAKDLFELKLHSPEFDKRQNKEIKRPVYSLPFVDALEGPDQNLPIGPYTVGVWLGDGVRTKQALTLGPDDADQIIAHLDEPYTEGPSHPDTGVLHFNIPNFQTRWRGLGMGYYETAVKRIPEIYLQGSLRQRRALLAGLVDSDGHVDNAGRVTFTGRNQELVEDVRHLVRSLGYRVGQVSRYDDERTGHTIDGNLCDSSGTDWRISWTPWDGQPQGYLLRKRSERVRKREHVYVTGVEWIGDHAGNCIQVDAEDGLYLAGEDLIPTHNSELVSKLFPVWFLGHNPDKRVVFGTYEAGFAQDIGGACRDMFEAFGETVFGLKVRQDARSKAKWMIDGHRGGMMAVGRGGSFTGRGADIMIIDDPIKNAEEAFSPTIRRHLIEWYTTTIRTRLQAGASVVLVLARWHNEDLAGWILNQLTEDWNGDPWEEFRMPMLAEENDMLGRAYGEPLWPEMYDKAYCEQTRDSVGEYTWNALYQQRPTPTDGGVLTEAGWRRAAAPPMEEVIGAVRFWDLSAGGVSSDYTSGCLMVRTRGNLFWILDMAVQSGLTAAESERFVRDTVTADMQLGLPKYSTAIEQVPGAGKAVAERYLLNVLTGYPAYAIPLPGGRGPKDKETRAGGMISAQQNRFIYLALLPTPDGRELFPAWHAPFVAQCALFPNSDYDDQVDAATGAYTFLLKDRTRTQKAGIRSVANRNI